MTSRKTAIPPLLEPYLSLPAETSVLLLTGVLSATPHWLTIRAIRGAYGSSLSASASPAAGGARYARQRGADGGDGSGDAGAGAGVEVEVRPETEAEGRGDVAVVLVSWLRDWEFWKGEARRGAVCSVFLFCLYCAVLCYVMPCHAMPCCVVILCCTPTTPFLPTSTRRTGQR